MLNYKRGLQSVIIHIIYPYWFTIELLIQLDHVYPTHQKQSEDIKRADIAILQWKQQMANESAVVIDIVNNPGVCPKPHVHMVSHL